MKKQMNCLQCGGLRVNFKMTKCFVFVECDENDPNGNTLHFSVYKQSS